MQPLVYGQVVMLRMGGVVEAVGVSLLLLVTIPLTSAVVEVGDWVTPTAHAIRGTISFPDPNTVIIDDFSYDGGGVVVFLYYYAPGQLVDGRSGVELPIPNGGSRGDLIRRYTNERLVVPLPTGVTACDIGSLTVWCMPYQVHFSRIQIPRSIFVNQGQGECQLLSGPSTSGPSTSGPSTSGPSISGPSTSAPSTSAPSTSGPSTSGPSTSRPSTAMPTVSPPNPVVNCEPFSDSLQVSWTVDTQNSEVDFQICSCRSLDAGVNQYMAFGLSASSEATFMIGADATVAWVDSNTGMPNAVDYILTQRIQCRGGVGVCPDNLVTRNGGLCRDDVRIGSITGGLRDGNQQCVAFSRPFITNDACDITITPSNMNQYIVWATGGLGETAFIHFGRADASSPPIHLAREPVDRCSGTSISCASCPVFVGRTITLLQDSTLSVRIGPAASERGYLGITGQVGWGIAWYIEGVLIPELVVTRGSTYTFVIEGGTDSRNLARYHPFYITNSINGGRLRNSQSARDNEIVYAGFDEMDNPTGVGRYCEYAESAYAGMIRERCFSFDNYLAAITTGGPQCDPGAPGMLTWTPDDSTPNVVYYQCATHLNLGWRIRVTGTTSRAARETPVTPTKETLATRDDNRTPVQNIDPDPSFVPATSNPSSSHKFRPVFLATLSIFIVCSLLII